MSRFKNAFRIICEEATIAYAKNGADERYSAMYSAVADLLTYAKERASNGNRDDEQEYEELCRIKDTWLGEGSISWRDALKVKGWSAEQVEAIVEHTKGIDWDHYDFCDNYRYARLDNAEEVEAYQNQQQNGCCGFYDVRLMDGTILFGFNYGH